MTEPWDIAPPVEPMIGCAIALDQAHRIDAAAAVRVDDAEHWQAAREFVSSVPGRRVYLLRRWSPDAVVTFGATFREVVRTGWSAESDCEICDAPGPHEYGTTDGMTTCRDCYEALPPEPEPEPEVVRG